MVNGYVLSALGGDGTYAGTYPDVDHEFQIKGRLAMADALDVAIVRRMLDLQLTLMKEDPESRWRNPCALQPDGKREYHVERKSQDRSHQAIMFLATGNAEILESAWLYVAASKDHGWLERNLEGLEGAASLLEELVDSQGRVWADAFYEDQVIKDGRECIAAVLTSRALNLLAELEAMRKKNRKAAHYRELALRIRTATVKSLPDGFWNPVDKRFVDWIDRDAMIHDHGHLLANILPILLEDADAFREASVVDFVTKNLDQFQRFPSFVAADVGSYNAGEIGSGGPYDLCAAARYWCWDAAFWEHQRDNGRIRQQLEQVTAEALSRDFVMAERYDMNYVYYTDGPHWHGAPHYYEYPCVFVWVLIHHYLGIQFTLAADLKVAPNLVEYGSVELEAERIAIRYQCSEESFTLWNLISQSRSFQLDLSKKYPHIERWDSATLGVLGSQASVLLDGKGSIRLECTS